MLLTGADHSKLMLTGLGHAFLSFTRNSRGEHLLLSVHSFLACFPGTWRDNICGCLTDGSEEMQEKA